MIEETPDITRAGVLESVLKGRDIAPDIIDSYLQGIYIQSKRYFSYGRDTYYLGLPQGTQEALRVENYKVQPIIEAEVGYPITIISSVLGRCDADYFAYPFLRDNRGWDYETNLCTHSFTVDDGFGTQVPVTEPVYFVNALFVNDTTIRIFYEYGAEGNFTEDTLVTGANPNEYFYHVIYVQRGTTEPRKYWNYDTSTNAHPSLGNVEAQELNSPYYPVVPVRENNVTLPALEDHDTDQWRTSKRLLDWIGLDWEQLGEGIDENPDVADIDHAYVIIGVDILDDRYEAKLYLYDYFTYLYGLNPNTKGAFDSYLSNQATYEDYSSPPPANIVEVSDSSYKIHMGYTYITNEVVSGSIGEVGSVTTTRTTAQPVVREGYAYETSQFVLRKQLTETTYGETIVAGLVHTNYVYGNYTVDSTLESAADTDSVGDRTNYNFIVPLNYNIVENMQLREANNLMYYSIYMVFNSVETVKLKWYQTGFFQFVVIIVAIAITVITYQPGALTQSIVGASVAGGLGTVALIMTDIMLAIALRKGFEIIAEEFGAELAFAAAIVLSMYSLGGAALDGLPFAEGALFMATNLTTAAQTVGMEEIQAETEAFIDEATRAQKELEEKWDTLDMQVDVDPVDLFTNFGDDHYYQSSEDFIHQAIHAGNVGVNTLNSINTYVENTMTLPTTSNSLGVNINV